MVKINDLTDQRFGRLTAKKVVNKYRNNRFRWLCKCDCGGTIIVREDHLISGNANSCHSLEDYMLKSKTKIKKSSKYKGVHWCNTSQKWIARIRPKGGNFFLGRFDDEKAAAREYNIKATELFGNNIWLNPV